MARVTHVKKAQQRYHTKPVIDPATGEQKQVPMMGRNGEQKTTKGGRPVFLRITERDTERPKPLFKCDAPGCGEDIQLGTPYKWVQPHGSSQRNRHAGCPSWQPWELSNSLSARVAQIQDGEPSDATSEDDINSWRDEKVEAIRELANEKEESATNMEDGFGHETEQSNELRGISEQLNSWADELEGADIPSFPEPEDEDCAECGGSGRVVGEDAEGNEIDNADCDECSGSGEVTPEDPTDEQIDEWREEAIQAVRDLLDQAPV